MIEPRQRILFTTVAALVVAIGVSLAVSASQEASGRAALTARAKAFLRSLKGLPEDGTPGRRVDPTEFLRPADRGAARSLLALERLQGAFGNANDDLLVAQVKILGNGRAVTYSPVELDVPMGRHRVQAGLRELAWVQGPDGRWYLDPAGL